MFIAIMDYRNAMEHEQRMEDIHRKHVTDMMRYGRDTMDVTYIVPRKQSRWQKFRKKVGVYPYVSIYTGPLRSGREPERETCRFYVVVPESVLFYMRMKRWVDVKEKDIAEEAMEYMQSKIQLP